MKVSVTIALCVSALALAGCASTAQLTPAAQTKVTATFAKLCPGISSGAFDAVAAKFNAKTLAAYQSAQTICASGAPTDAVTASLDILAIEPLLAPYLAKK